jgi:plasmid stabilization system protein ParE
MKRHLIILQLARSDINRIFSWLWSRSEKGAVSWNNALDDKIDVIRDNPDLFARARESTHRWRRDVREALFKTSQGRKYRIIFEKRDEAVVILRVRKPGQRPIRRSDLP